MKKNVLALSIAAMIGGLGFAGAASAQSALQVNESGTGHMLLVPYYTAQNGNMSVFHVVNTDTVNGKALKVRFRGASNSDDVLDFQVFMSPGDVWTAAVTQGSDGVANLVTADGTCTLPAIAKGVAVPFVQDQSHPLRQYAQRFVAMKIAANLFCFLSPRSHHAASGTPFAPLRIAKEFAYPVLSL